jgi:lipid A 3-O-deacylase
VLASSRFGKLPAKVTRRHNFNRAMTKTKQLIARSAILVLAALGVQVAHAMDFHPDGTFATVGVAPHGTATLGAGLVWDWGWRADRQATLTARTELIVAGWRADANGGGSQSLAQMVLLPVLHMQLDRGRSPWFLEFGIGASVTDKIYRTPHKFSSTRWNFYDMLGAGYSFGAGRKQELALRYVHISNLGLKRPNPGEDFLQLRYGVHF